MERAQCRMPLDEATTRSAKASGLYSYPNNFG